MSSTPASRAARNRLRDAQQAEARALREVGAAAKARERVAALLHDADTALVRAQVAVVETSGLDRAAYLLDVDRAELRRRARDAQQAARVEGQPVLAERVDEVRTADAPGRRDPGI